VSAVANLKFELADRARQYASVRPFPFCLGYGDSPVVCFQACGEAQHGNFHPASYKALQANPEWRRRLKKVHTTAKTILPRAENGNWRELDSCMSSDALLMNVFCHPEVLRSARVASMLGLEAKLNPRFGVPARVPLLNGRLDRTEVDLKIGELLVEAKLTEIDFQRAKKTSVLRYRDFRRVFEEDLLPQVGDYYNCYQLIRNVLAAYASQCSLCVLLDVRRPDLVDAWYTVMRSIQPVALRTACKVLTWQELSRVLPASMQAFLAVKYGIQ
jgi:hypothetical protein